MTNSHALNNILSGRERGKYVLNSDSRSEVCSVAEKSEYKGAWPWCLLSKKCVVTGHMVGDDKISLEDLCFLRQNAVLLGKHVLEFEAAICSKMSVTI
jgi:hypothetical protein